MPEEILAIIIVSIVFGTSLIALIFTGIYKLIKAKINQGNNQQGQINPQFFKALGEFKKKTERRLSNLEEVVSDIEEERYRISDSEEQLGDIEIEEEEIRSSSEKQEEDDGNLRNMLNE